MYSGPFAGQFHCVSVFFSSQPVPRILLYVSLEYHVVTFILMWTLSRRGSIPSGPVNCYICRFVLYVLLLSFLYSHRNCSSTLRIIIDLRWQNSFTARPAFTICFLFIFTIFWLGPSQTLSSNSCD